GGVPVVPYQHHHRDVREGAERRLVDDDAGDGEVVVAPADLRVVDGGEAVGRDAARFAGQVREDGHARTGPGACLAERELEGGAEVGGRVERCEGVETLAHAVRVGGPSEHHVR